MVEEETTRSPHASSWIALSDANGFPTDLTQQATLSTSASSSSLSSAMDMATYAPQQYGSGQQPGSPNDGHAQFEDRARRFSISSASGVTLEDDIRSIGDQMKRVLAFCEMQSQNPIRLQAKINDLQEQLQLAVAEKNYWMKKCKEQMGQSSGNVFSEKEGCETVPLELRAFVACVVAVALLCAVVCTYRFELCYLSP